MKVPSQNKFTNQNMENRKYLIVLAILLAILSGCTPELMEKTLNDEVPENYSQAISDTVNSATAYWNSFYTDPYLSSLIDSALSNNQELNITIQEIESARAEVMGKKGEYLPSISIGADVNSEKVGRYTSQGANDANTEIEPGTAFPEPLPHFMVGAFATWELDVWKRLRNAKKAAVTRYLGSVEGQNFMRTRIIAEIANSYYELLALDNQLEILKQNIAIQSNALETVKLQKANARITELAVQRFEAQVFNSRSVQFLLEQKIVEAENGINFLVGRFPQTVQRSSEVFKTLAPNVINAGIPSQLLENRPDVRQAELELAAAKLDVKVAKAHFYPSIGIRAGIGFEAFDPTLLMRSPESLLYTIGGDLMAPLINRKAIKAMYFKANARQIQAVYNYEQTILKAYVEVANQLSRIGYLEKSYALKAQAVEALNASVNISNELFLSARADYVEVLLTQRDALETQFELIETKRDQLISMVLIYQALGGGWR